MAYVYSDALLKQMAISRRLNAPDRPENRILNTGFFHERGDYRPSPLDPKEKRDPRHGEGGGRGPA